MNWKNLKLGKKITFGFTLVLTLTIVVGIFSYTGLNSVKLNAEQLSRFYMLEESVYQAMSERKNYMIKTDEQSLENWNIIMENLYAQIEELRNMLANNNDVIDIDKLKLDADHYKEAFLHYVDSREDEKKIALRWKELGEQFFEVINETKSRYTDKDILIFVSELENKFALMRVSAVYYIKDKTNERWIEFESAMNTMKETLKRSSLYGTDFQTNISTLNDFVDAYIVESGKFYKDVQIENEDNLKMAEAATDFLEIVKKSNNDQEQKMNNSIRQNILFIIIVICFALLSGISIAFVITRSITKPIIKGVDFAKAVAEGDLTANVDIEQKDEIGVLASSLKGMVNTLREIVMSIIAGADNIASASQELSSSSQEMSQGASEQASSAEEVSSSMEEMSSNIQQNTENAQQTEKIAINAFEGINKVAGAAKESLESTRQIAEKITIVNDIAFQTNILALNAAVEAARAGEHGKGFAVVAAEVRKLAERSKVAADEINELSGKSLKVTEDAGGLMEEIIPEIERTAKLVQEISAASLEQNTGSEQINSAIQQLSQVTQQNAAASEEMATSSEELASQSQQLKEIISYFKISNNGKSGFLKKNKLQEFKNENKIEKAKSVKDIGESNKKEIQNSGFDLNLADKNKLDNEFESF